MSPRDSLSLPNPLISGFNPDPSIVKVGGDYYLATSTFEYLPGIPIYHSTDLVSWTRIGHVVDREGQLHSRDVPTLGGAWAPTIRFHDGQFYLARHRRHGPRNPRVHGHGPGRPVERRPGHRGRRGH